VPQDELNSGIQRLDGEIKNWSAVRRGIGREIGLRMALGARRGDILKLILQKGAVLASTGIVAGVIFSASTSSMMASLLYGVRPRDPAVFLIVPALLFTVAFLASYIPARRATKVDPMAALREA
jgi:putative ABC transport system permease protein